MKKNTISVIIITKNNQEKIVECLNSVKWSDEIIIVDTGSTDNTINIAEKYGCKIFKTLKGSYSEWRNFGLKKAKTDWILYVDSDEFVSSNLRKEISLLIEKGDGGYGCYAIPRLNNVLGKNLFHGGWYPDYVKRLFPTKKLKKWVGKLHEEPVFLGDLGKLKNNLHHQKEQQLSDMVIKSNKWSNIEAKLMYDADHPNMNVIRFMSAMFREFWYRFVLKLGFLDGAEGIIFNLYQVYSKFLSYAKLWEMQINRVEKL